MDDLMIDAVDVLPKGAESGDIEAMRADKVVAHLVEITADDGERTVDVVKNAGVNFRVGAGEFFAKLAIVNFALEFAQATIVRANFASDRAARHRFGDGFLHALDGVRLANVIAGAKTEGFASRLQSFVSGQHDDLGAGIDFLQFAEKLDARHARHANVADDSIDFASAGNLDGFGALFGEEDLILVAKKHP